MVAPRRLASAKAYRESMAEFAEMRTMDIWYAHLSEQDLLDALGAATGSAKGADRKQATAAQKNAEKATRKAHTRDSLQALSKLAELVDGRYRIVSQPPVVVPLRDLSNTHGYSVDQLEEIVHEQFRAYRETLQDDRRQLLERFEWVDMARKVVGVGSVGTRAFIVLLQGRDEQDPLFLQVKEATTSVLEDHLPKSRYKQPGERVVQGQRRMQAASDIFLGWTKGAEADRFLYWRQLRDMKGSAVVEVDVAGDARACTRASAAGRWHGRTLDREIPSPSLRTSARRASSKSRSATSRNGTPTRTTRTTKRSAKPSAPVGSRRSRASESALARSNGTTQQEESMQAESNYDTYQSSGAGWKTFAGIMVIIVGVFNVIDGLRALTSSNQVEDALGGTELPLTNDVKTWGWVILIIGAVMILSGFLIFSGNMFGRIVGVLIAAANMIVQISYLDHNPFWSFTIIIVDVLIIYGLVAHGGRIDEWSTD